MEYERGDFNREHRKGYIDGFLELPDDAPISISIKIQERIKFVLNGCDIQLIADAPADITLRDLLKQCDKIQPDWCACGICSINRAEYSPDISVDVYIDYDSVRKANDDVCCRIMEDKQ